MPSNPHVVPLTAPMKITWRLSSFQAIVPYASEGVCGVCTSCQFLLLPSQIQVSNASVHGSLLPTQPPYRTTHPWIQSNAIGARVRVGGLDAGCCAVQSLPFQVQVSFRNWKLVPAPPKSTMPLYASYSMLA